ncbi:hypothetical protein JKP88DRAFT_276354 [Tribonema minus]|uniref:Uncharacterized protein n=1 Tax=Tribonema minus TaxID=303371 RepID=A0A835Z524_9STRA|nr:hypothetical protein JKP88DRAFT_276354 [Tribonema minus]
MVVEQHMVFGIPDATEGKHPQKFYFVPDKPPRAEPRMVVLQSSGQLTLHDSINSDFTKGYQFLNMDSEVQWDGFMSMAFDPQWPQQPFIYVYYIGYTNIDMATQGQQYPNKDLLRQGAQRPANWNGWGDRGMCNNVADLSNYLWTANKCPNFKADPESCGPMAWSCETFSRVDRVTMDPNTFKVLKRAQVYGSPRACGGFWGHLWSNIMFLSDDSMVFGMGDHALDFIPSDPGDPRSDMCYDTAAGAPQGQWNAQREHNDIGKFLRVFPGRFRTATAPIQIKTDYEIIAKGMRNPYSSMVLPDDTIWVGDVGNGEAERIFHFNARGSSQERPVLNMAWPCFEGEKGAYLVEAWSEQERVKYMKAQGYTLCDPVFKGSKCIEAQGHTLCDPVFKAAGVRPEFFVGDPATTVPEPHYFGPTYEFRDLPDPTYANCGGDRAAVSGIYFNEGAQMGTKYENKLFFSDHAKRCLFTGSLDANGKVINVRALMAAGDVGISHITRHPVTGAILVLDYQNSRILSLASTAVLDPNEKMNLEVVVAPLTAVPPPPAGASPVKFPTKQCAIAGKSDNMGTLAWTQGADGVLRARLDFEPIQFTNKQGTTRTRGRRRTARARLDFEPIQFTNKHGTTRTRGYNGHIPGPIIRMQACKTYQITLRNGLAGWANVPGAENTMHSPQTTNLHTHGLHISGMGTADNVAREMLPGSDTVITYAIPCDHAGGTHFYHPHHHGSVTLQAFGGAAGILQIDDNPAFEIGDHRPAIYGQMPNKYLIFQYVHPAFLNERASAMKDDLFASTATERHYLTNGCADYTTGVTLGKWTRLRMLHIGRKDNAIASITARDGGKGACKVALIAKDGVYDNEAGRILADGRVFFSISSRVDAAVYCDTAGLYDVVLTTGGMDAPVTVATLSVTGATPVHPAELPIWRPCRPHYLQDLRPLPVPATKLDITLANGAIDGKLYGGPDDAPLTTLAEGDAAEVTLSGTSAHPFHMHVNHFQLQADQELPGLAPGWYRAGDWLDTLAVGGTAVVRFRADRYGGNMIAHCHIFEHSDTGMMTKIAITGGAAVDEPSTRTLHPRPMCA